VEQAALSHHESPLLVDDEARRSLLNALHLKEGGENPPLAAVAPQLLKTLRGRKPSSDPGISRLAAVLEIADDFDQFFEAEPLGELDPGDTWTRSSVDTMMSYLQLTSRADVGRVTERLPVFPLAATEVVRCVSNDNVSLSALSAAASKDPVLAGTLIKAANSSYYSPRQPIAKIQQAVSYIGLDATRKVLLAASLQPAFASRRSFELWNHSLEVAELAERGALFSHLTIDPSEAFLAGLVHDIGRLAFSIMPTDFLERFYRLTEKGCPPTQVEVCLSGVCHGEVGAETLQQWKFPPALVEAIRWHHRPERSTSELASLLYVCEFLSGSDEDLSSEVRLTTACKQAGLERDSLFEPQEKKTSCLASLRLAA
jgi:putative nucleotidyltransferase with HDIG domain